MKIEEIDQHQRYAYIEKCPCCDLEQEILTQNNNFAEYETEIYLKCQCGEFIQFVLPVN